MRPAALQALADAAEALARLAREAASDPDGQPQDDALVPVTEVARLAATSVRVVRDAIRNRELAAFGRMRDRAVRRCDLEAWIASRRLAPVEGVDDRTSNGALRSSLVRDGFRLRGLSGRALGRPESPP